MYLTIKKRYDFKTLFSWSKYKIAYENLYEDANNVQIYSILYFVCISGLKYCAVHGVLLCNSEENVDLASLELLEQWWQ